ncbi:aminotransferase class I/II-fold pyridoxal phosphate-dependent enzyme [Saccharothrix longispora]|uniref:trans-sulfuration enzyme family protein n=1 Tax=Saccharothrix longispora TaxID=33920 RepID=UPI0028FCFB3E|nr:aminotransferase class I/II-fold pyridoxal phosphate-dependent enzyme [Saccharothrix longispora]MBY8851102.1 aminotransferase class I/II-fold pyridoxal phosphate-dependent enzyme [Saccharothrix sp. MB29]MDU0290777.1 aminotransferase class I/II-fold pyridoxal phosphate-dependent enzyme [Saccharothrix longispora]
MRPETRLVHTRTPRPAGTPLTVPLYQTSGFSFDDLETFADGMGRPDGAFAYTRMGNPTVRALEDAVADLEGGAAGLAAASGMGAIGSVLHGVLRTGDHVVAQRDLYGGAHALLRDLAERWGVTVTRVSGHDPDELRAALGPRTRLLYLETIANPTGHVSDLAALAAAAREAGVLVVVDNTFATPLLCRPVEHGADVVVHSTTKYLAGHSDVIGGVAVFADAALHREVWEHAVEYGATADPFAAWLTLRGLRTLSLRMRAHCANAEVLVHRLAAHPAVAAVHWPGLPDHPSHEVAGRLLSGCGGTFSFDLVGGRAAGEAFVGALRLVKLAPSLGGTETLVLHPASTSHRRLDEAELRAAGIAGGTIRLSAGVEHVDDLWDDLVNALP